jgi:hypothetical protein
MFRPIGLPFSPTPFLKGALSKTLNPLANYHPDIDHCGLMDKACFGVNKSLSNKILSSTHSLGWAGFAHCLPRGLGSLTSLSKLTLPAALSQDFGGIRQTAKSILNGMLGRAI